MVNKTEIFFEALMGILILTSPFLIIRKLCSVLDKWSAKRKEEKRKRQEEERADYLQQKYSNVFSRAEQLYQIAKFILEEKSCIFGFNDFNPYFIYQGKEIKMALLCDSDAAYFVKNYNYAMAHHLELNSDYYMCNGKNIFDIFQLESTSLYSVNNYDDDFKRREYSLNAYVGRIDEDDIWDVVFDLNCRYSTYFD